MKMEYCNIIKAYGLLLFVGNSLGKKWVWKEYWIIGYCDILGLYYGVIWLSKNYIKSNLNCPKGVIKINGPSQ